MILIEPLIDLSLAGVALLLLILAFGLFLLRGLLVQSLGHLPGVGPIITSTLGRWLEDARAAVLSAASASWDGARHLFQFVWTLIARDSQILTTVIGVIADTIWHVAVTQIPRAYHQAVAFADHGITVLRHDLTAGLHGLEHRLSAAISQTLRDARNWYRDALRSAGADAAAASHLARSLFRTAESDLSNGIGSAEAIAAAELSATASVLAGDIAGVRAAADAMFRIAETDLHNQVAGAEHAASVALDAAVKGIWTDLEKIGNVTVGTVWPDAAGDIEALRRAIGGGFPGINGLLGALGGLGAAGLAGALIRSIAGTATAVKALDDCVIPQCENMGGYSSFLKDLLSAGADVALTAWVIQMIADPAAWSDDVVTVGTPIVTDTLDALLPLVGAL